MQTGNYTNAAPVFPQVCAARYEDSFGKEDAVVIADGGSLILRVRGVDLIAYQNFDFEPPTPVDQTPPEQFLWGTDLCLKDFLLSFTLSVPVTSMEETVLEMLDIAVDRGAYDTASETALTLHRAGITYTVSEQYCEFEFLLDRLARLLPPGVYLRTCYNCLYSDYSPFGKSGFGNMECHRNAKAAYLAVGTKQDYFRLRSSQQVHEIYHCLEWEKRTAGTGYRG